MYEQQVFDTFTSRVGRPSVISVAKTDEKLNRAWCQNQFLVFLDVARRTACSPRFYTVDQMPERT